VEGRLVEGRTFRFGHIAEPKGSALHLAVIRFPVFYTFS
jgi:hypothetical protein